jgi:adenylate cyclase
VTDRPGESHPDQDSGEQRALHWPQPRLAEHAAELIKARTDSPLDIASIAGNIGFVTRTYLWLAALAVLANVGATAVATALVFGVNHDDVTNAQAHDMLSAVVAVVSVEIVLGVVLASLLQRRTLRWLLRGEVPTEQDAKRALRMPRDMGILAAVMWGTGSLIITGVALASGVKVGVARGTFGGIIISGLIASGVTYLLLERASRPVIRLVLAEWPPRTAPAFDLRWRLIAVWLLTSGAPLVGILLILTAPGRRVQVVGAAALAGVVAIGVGGLATILVARSIGLPLRELVTVLDRVGQGDLEVSVPVEDAGEIGLVQNVVNEMVEGLRERDRISDLFGRHVGPAVAAEALRSGVTLSGELRNVVALFVDITGSTVMTQSHEPVEFVAMLNRFFQVVVDEVEAQGGLINKFQGDAALAIFGAPVVLIDPATSALRASRRIRDRVHGMGEFEAGIGVAYGPVVAGQIGAHSRLEFTVIGDAVNQAARLTDLAKAQRQHLLASGAVIEHAAEDETRNWSRAGEAVLRGRTVPTELWTA